jgi:hypothetical protein
MANNNGTQVGKAVAGCPNQPDKVEEKKLHNLHIKCKHRDCPVHAYIKHFDVVPDPGVLFVDELITITWTGNDPKPPASLTTSIGKEITGPPYLLPASFFGLASIVDALFPASYKACSDESKGKVQFGIDFLTYAFTFYYKKSLSLVGLPWSQFDFVVYNPDQWKLEIELPISGKSKYKRGLRLDKELTKDGAKIKTKTSYSSSGESSSSTTEQYREKNYGDRTAASSTTTNVESEDGETMTTTDRTGVAINTNTGRFVANRDVDISLQDSEKEKQIIKVEKNGAPFKVGAITIIKYIFKSLKIIKEFQKILKDIPQFGAYMNFEVNVLQGSMSFAWGFKEYTDHRAYMEVKGEISIVFVDATFEVGVGVSGFSVKFQAFASINGKIEFKGEAKREKPYDDAFLEENKKLSVNNAGKFYFESENHMSASLSASLVGTVGARFEALYYVKLDPKLEAGFKGEGKIDLFTEKHIAEISTVVKFTGINASVEVSEGPADALGKERPAKKGLLDKLGIGTESSNKTGGDGSQLLGEYVFYRSKFPDDMHGHHDDDELEGDEIKGLIKEMLNGRYLNSGWFSSYTMLVLTEKTDYSKVTYVDKMKAGLYGATPMEEVDQDQVSDNIFSAIHKEKNLDLSKDSMELLLLEIRNELSRFYHDKGKGYVHFDELKSFTSGKMTTILKGYLDTAKVFRSKHKDA